MQQARLSLKPGDGPLLGDDEDAQKDAFDYQNYRRRSRGNSQVFSQAALNQGQPAKATGYVENTYRLEPSRKPKTSVIHGIIEDCLATELKDFTYDRKEAPSMCKKVSQEIRRRVKLQGWPRYKFICTVYIGQKENSTSQISSRFLWEPKFDTWASGNYINRTSYAVGIVVATYME